MNKRKLKSKIKELVEKSKFGLSQVERDRLKLLLYHKFQLENPYNQSQRHSDDKVYPSIEYEREQRKYVEQKLREIL